MLCRRPEHLGSILEPWCLGIQGEICSLHSSQRSSHACGSMMAKCVKRCSKTPLHMLICRVKIYGLQLLCEVAADTDYGSQLFTVCSVDFLLPHERPGYCVSQCPSMSQYCHSVLAIKTQPMCHLGMIMISDLAIGSSFTCCAFVMHFAGPYRVMSQWHVD